MLMINNWNLSQGSTQESYGREFQSPTGTEERANQCNTEKILNCKGVSEEKSITELKRDRTDGNKWK